MEQPKNTLEVIQKTQEYLNYIKEHVENVHKAWEVVKIKCKDMRFMWDDFYYFSIQDAVDLHDLSKLSEQEFVQYRKSFYACEGEPPYEMAEAWEHHKMKNPHHYENWTSVSWGDCFYWEVHCVHMILDWIAMGYKFGNTARDFYEKNKVKIGLSSAEEGFVNEIFDRVYGPS